jgi:uncharacterized membrane protein
MGENRPDKLLGKLLAKFLSENTEKRVQMVFIGCGGLIILIALGISILWVCSINNVC